MLRIFAWLALFLICASGAEGAELQLIGRGQKITVHSDDLLAAKELETVIVQDDPCFPGRTTQYKAIRLSLLLKKLNVQPDEIVEARASDGFVAVFYGNRLINQAKNRATAYLAIEPRDTPWPVFKKGKTPGPFYIIWSEPDLSNVTTYEWPNQLVSLEIKGTAKSVYPKIQPAPNASREILHGLDEFVRNCFACHEVNGQGPSKVGPNLNIALDKLTDSQLRSRIRGERFKSGMPRFTESMLSDNELRDLIRYLRHVAKEN